MRKYSLFALAFGLMFSVSVYAQTDTKGDFFFSGGFYLGFFGDESRFLAHDIRIGELNIVKFSA